MLLSLWRSLRNRNAVPSRGRCLRRVPALSSRPGVERLEGRALPSLMAGGVLLAPVPGAVGGLQPAGSRRALGTTPTRVTVNQNSSETVIDLGAVFGGMSGLQHGD